MMTKDAVVTRLCALASELGEKLGHVESHDCFCAMSTEPASDFRFSEDLLDFIETAVREKAGIKA